MQKNKIGINVLKNTGNIQKTKIKIQDLPLHCPRELSWDLHPRVFIPIEKTGKGSCPYCGSIYELVDAE